MDTLPRDTWNSFFESKEHYLKFRARWAQLNDTSDENRPLLAAAYYLLTSALRGRDWRRGFAPVTNQTKLAHGAQPLRAASQALWDCKSPYNRRAGFLAVFDGLVTEEMANAACAWLPDKIDPQQTEIESAYLSPAVGG